MDFFEKIPTAVSKVELTQSYIGFVFLFDSILVVIMHSPDAAVVLDQYEMQSPSINLMVGADSLASPISVSPVEHGHFFENSHNFNLIFYFKSPLYGDLKDYIYLNLLS